MYGVGEPEVAIIFLLFAFRDLMEILTAKRSEQKKMFLSLREMFPLTAMREAIGEAKAAARLQKSPLQRPLCANSISQIDHATYRNHTRYRNHYKFRRYRTFVYVVLRLHITFKWILLVVR